MDKGAAMRVLFLSAVLGWPLAIRTAAQGGPDVTCVSACGQPPQSAQAAGELSPSSDRGAVPDATPDPSTTHILGVIPNYLTVEGEDVPPISSRQKFKLVALDTFDPFMYPYVGGIALFTHNYGPGVPGFEKQYLASVTDNAAGNFMTSAVLPSLLHQDPRYFERGSGAFLSRAAYAATRNIVTRSDDGHPQFNTSEILGNAVAASAASLYYPRTQRSASAMLTRWGMQMVWDTVSNEVKEFWPDVRHRFRRQE